MYALVADIERYPEFLPWCVALRVVSRREEPPVAFATADMIAAYGAFREKFRTIVRLDRPGRRIDVAYVEGPFRTLTNAWAFEERSDGGSTIDFLIEFEFKSLVLQATAKAMFERVFLKMSDAFVARAGSIYG